MELKLKRINEDKIIASFANQELEISPTSEEWTIDGINKFLIKLASFSPDKIELIIDQNVSDNDEIYNHIKELFEIFVNEFNDKIEKEAF